MAELQPALLAHHFLANCAFGRMLVLDGSGGSSLSPELRLAGAEVVEISSNDIGHDRIGEEVLVKRLRTQGTNTFTSALCVDLLDRFDVASITKILVALREVVTRHLMLCLNHQVATTPPREWWDDLAISQGWRRHARLMSIVPYHELESNGAPMLLMFERLRDSALEAFPLVTLKEERDLHMDMGRESGRRADAHIARYHYASQLIRHGDIVIDAACGLGYGSQLLWASGLPSKVIGFDVSKSAVRYCTANFALPDGSVSFCQADLGRGVPMPDDSVDFITSFETLEHLCEPEAFLEEAFRVLKPSGRLVVSVPNLWCDEDGNDPNPHHFHVYDREKLVGQLRKWFFIEQMSSQVAGGGMTLTDRPRSWIDLPPHRETGLPEAEWWIAVGMKVEGGSACRDVGRSQGQNLVEQGFTAIKPTPVSVDFSGYERPWLIRSLVSTGWRMRDREALVKYARIVEFESAAGSEEQGASLCVQGYRLLERVMRDGSGRDQSLEVLLADYVNMPASPRLHVERWRVSIAYLLGRISAARGEPAEAVRWYTACVAGKAGTRIPTLGTKVVEAYLHLGLLAVVDDPQTARQYWIKGQDHAVATLRGDWRELIGSIEQPFFFGYDEALLILSLARDCSNCLLGLQHPQKRDMFEFGAPNHRAPGPLRQTQLSWLRGHQEAVRLYGLLMDSQAREAAIATRITELELGEKPSD